MKDYNELIGKYIIQIKENEDYIDFITKDNYAIRINKFEPYCACYVGEYIDEISKDGNCFGTITNIEKNIKKNNCDEIVYKGNVTFYFENGKLNMNVHGEDNGYYGVEFTMPIEVLKI